MSTNKQTAILWNSPVSDRVLLELRLPEPADGSAPLITVPVFALAPAELPLLVEAANDCLGLLARAQAGGVKGGETS